MSCESVREHLLTASVETFDTVEAHLEGCPACRQLAERVRLAEALAPHHEPAQWRPMAVVWPFLLMPLAPGDTAVA